MLGRIVKKKKGSKEMKLQTAKRIELVNIFRQSGKISARVVGGKVQRGNIGFWKHEDHGYINPESPDIRGQQIVLSYARACYFPEQGRAAATDAMVFDKCAMLAAAAEFAVQDSRSDSVATPEQMADFVLRNEAWLIRAINRAVRAWVADRLSDKSIRRVIHFATVTLPRLQKKPPKA
jgi:hypothetical protein